MNIPQPNLLSFAFVDPTMLLSTTTLKYGRHFGGNDQPRHLTEWPYDKCQHIVLRGPEDGNWSSDGPQNDQPLYAEWPSARQTIAAVGAQITEHLAAENLQFGRIYLESLGAGGVVGWHADQTPYSKMHQRFRLLVSPCAGGCWYSGGEMLAPGVGNLTYFNSRVLHSAINLGPVPQISLVLDVRRPALQ